MILVDQWATHYGLNRTLAALGLSKGTWHYRQRCWRAYTEKYASLRDPLLEIAHEHPHYGYRKVTRELRDTYGCTVNAKVVRRLQKAWELPLIRAVHPPKPSAIRRVIQQIGDRAILGRRGRTTRRVDSPRPILTRPSQIRATPFSSSREVMTF